MLWVLLFLFAWGVWLWNLGLGSLSFDESATYFVAYRPPLEILQYIRRAAHEHPPVYYLLVRGWMALAGTSEFSLRFFSLGVGMIALALTGWLARLAGRQGRGASLKGVDLVTAVILAAVPGMAFYVRDARMYSLVIVWTVLAAGLLLRDWLPTTERPRWSSVLALMSINGLAIFTHYYLILMIVAQPLALLAARRWRSFWTWIIAHSMPGLAGVLWFWMATGLQKTMSSVFANAELSLPSVHRVTSLLTTLLSSAMFGPQSYLLPITLALLLAGVLVAWWRQWRIGVWLLAMLIVPFVLAFVLPRRPQPRYLVFLLPFAALAMAHLLLLPARLIKFKPAGWMMGLGLTAVTAWMLVNAGLIQVLTVEKSRYGQTLETVKSYTRPGDEALFYGPWQVIPFHYYDPGGMPPYTLLPPQAPPVLDPAQAGPVLEALLARAGRLWVIPMADALVDPDLFVWQWLRTHAHAVWQEDDFRLYLPPLPDDAPTQLSGLVFGQALVLEQFAFEPGPIAAGEPIRLTLFWRFLKFPAQGVELTLSLVDEAGQVWKTAVSFLESDSSQGNIIDYQGLMVPQGASPGEYTVRLRLVDKVGGTPMLVNGQEVAVLQSFPIVEPDQEPILVDLPGAVETAFCQPDGSKCLNLVGVEPGGVKFPSGFPLPLKLHWQSDSASLPDLQARLQVIPDPWLSWPGSEETPVITKTIPLVPGYSTSQWPPGRLVSLPAALSLPPDAPDSRARVTLELIGPDGRSWPTASETKITLFHIIIEKRPTQTKPPSGLASIQVDFGQDLGLRGYRVEGSTCPGGQLKLTYAWYAHAQPSAIYAVFNHLVTTDEKPVAQVDGWPQEGRLLTNQWQPGEYIEDSYIIDIPQDAVSGPYLLYVGFYNAANGVRLPAFQDGQQLPADRVSIPLPESCE